MTCLKVPIVEQLHTLEVSVGAKTHGFQTQKPQKFENVWVLTQYNPNNSITANIFESGPMPTP